MVISLCDCFVVNNARQGKSVNSMCGKNRRGEINSLASKLNVTEAYNEKLSNSFDATIWTFGCSSWYLDNDGIPATYPGAPSQYQREMQNPDLSDYELVRS